MIVIAIASTGLIRMFIDKKFYPAWAGQGETGGKQGVGEPGKASPACPAPTTISVAAGDNGERLIRRKT